MTGPVPAAAAAAQRRLWEALLVVKRARLIGLLLPTLIESFEADRQMRLPSGAEIPQLMIDETARLRSELEPLTGERTTAVQLAVDSERQRLAGLESKGFAVAAFPLAVVATSAVLVGKNDWTTTFSFLAIVYAALALVSAGRIVNPGTRASFVVSDARQPDWLARLAATAEVNRSISIAIQNRVYAALMDTVRGVLAVVIATSLLLINVVSGTNGHNAQLPSRSPTSTAVTANPSSTGTVQRVVTPTPSTTEPTTRIRSSTSAPGHGLTPTSSN